MDQDELARLLSGGGHLRVEVTRWGFICFNDPSMRGVNTAGAEEGYPRLSSHVVAFDTAAMTATTASGRVYVLVGNPDPSYALHVQTMFDQLRGQAFELVELGEAVET